MEHNERNEGIRLKMLNEIADIEAFVQDQSVQELLNDKLRQKTVVMSLINIGELSKAFSADYLDSMPEIPWKAIRGFRNIAVHQYGSIEFTDVYKTVSEDIPLLKASLEKRGIRQ